MIKGMICDVLIQETKKKYSISFNFRNRAAAKEEILKDELAHIWDDYHHMFDSSNDDGIIMHCKVSDMGAKLWSIKPFGLILILILQNLINYIIESNRFWLIRKLTE